MAPPEIVPVTDLGLISTFDVTDLSSVGFRWTRWLRAFELFAEGKGVTNPKQRKALLLHSAGTQVQDIFYTFDEKQPEDGETPYSVAVKQLNEYFTPKVNVAYERSVFRSMGQTAAEPMDSYITRLLQKAEHCNFHDKEEMIRDQIIEKCYSQRLRRKFLEKPDIQLKEIKDMSRAMEYADRQASSMEVGTHDQVGESSASSTTSAVNKVDYKHTRSRYQSSKSDSRCWSCGYEGHRKGDPTCPAKSRKCRSCHRVGHFEKCCKSRDKSKSRRGSSRHFSTRSKVRMVDDIPQGDEDGNFVFTVRNNQPNPEYITVTIGGVSVPVVIDSGAGVNILDRNQWEKLKKEKVKCTSRLSEKKLFAYGSRKPLTIAGCFTADVSIGSKTVPSVDFYVMEEKGEALLGKETAVKLGILHIGSPTVYQIEEKMDPKGALLKKFPEVFKGLGKLKDYQLDIPLREDVKPVIQPMRRVPYHLRSKLASKLNELESMDIIEKVEGPSEWSSPVVVVPKSNGDIRLCVDMRKANQAVVRERYPIPTVEEILQDLNQSKVFSKLDVKWAYHQIELSTSSREITTFQTHKGLYRYKRLMFGVSCAPEMYNKLIHQILENCEGVHSIFDDIVVHGASQLEHDQNLDKVLQKLSEKGITLNLDKCELNMPHINFMGHILSEHGASLQQDKVEAIVNARQPASGSEIRSFLGLVNFSARFLPNLATVSEPLRRLTRKSVSFHWGPEQEKSFQELKTMLANTSVLGYFDVNATTQVIADASPVGLGAVLVQQQKEGTRVICYASRSLTDIERRFSQTEKEALALVWACERFHMYLFGQTFELVTDHKPLQFIFSSKSKPCARVERWILRLQSYSYKVKYVPGHQNIADCLSRLLSVNPKSRDTSDCCVEDYIRRVVEYTTPVAMTTHQIERASAEDSVLEEIRNCLLSGRWDKMRSKEFIPVKDELCAVGNLVLRGTRIVVPTALRKQILDLGHEGHPGIVLMKQRIRSKLWWPGMDKEIEQHCKMCFGCQLMAKPIRPEPMVRTELPSRPWEHVAVDFLGPLPTGESLFTVVDYYSRWLEVTVMKTTTTEKVIDSLKTIFATHGIPLSLRSDNGPQFVSETFLNFMREYGIVHRRSTPLWPQANGEIEIQNKSLMKRIRIAVAENKSWKEELRVYLLMYRSTPHSVTGVSPAKMLFGREIRTKLPNLHEHDIPVVDLEVRDRDRERKEKGKIYSDNRRQAIENDLKVGDSVLMKQKRRDKLSTNFCPKPFLVIQKNGNSVNVESDDGVTYRRNVTHLKKFQSGSDSVESEPNVHTENSECSVVSENKSCESSKPNNERTPKLSSDEMTSVDSAIEPYSEARPSRERKLPSRFSDFVMSV